MKKFLQLIKNYPKNDTDRKYWCPWYVIAWRLSWYVPFLLAKMLVVAIWFIISFDTNGCGILWRNMLD